MLYQTIKSLRPCKAGLRYAQQCQTTDELIANVKSGDWLLWLAYKLNVNPITIALAKIECARYMVSLIKPTDGYSGWTVRKEDLLVINESLDVASNYCSGDATYSDVENAAKRVYNRFPKSSGYISVGSHLCIPIYFALCKHAELVCSSISTTVANHKSAFGDMADDFYDKIIEDVDNQCMAILHRHLDVALTESIYNRLISGGDDC